jgi:hypothetical protein
MAKGVDASVIDVPNPDHAIVNRLVSMGVNATPSLFNDFVLSGNVRGRYNVLYVDTCGFFETQIRAGLEHMLRQPREWFAERTLLACTTSLRESLGDGPLHVFRFLREGLGNTFETLMVENCVTGPMRFQVFLLLSQSNVQGF